MTTATRPPAGPLSEEDAEILEALLQPRDGAVAHGDPSQLREIVQAGDEDLPTSLGVHVIQDAGTVVIYDAKTGRPSRTNANMLVAQLKKVGPDGQRMFTQRRPAVESPVKTLKCLLHPDRREPEWDEWGLPVCLKDNLPSPLQVDLHMTRRHPQSWAAIKADREKKDRDEERNLQRQIAAAAIARDTRVK